MYEETNLCKYFRKYLNSHPGFKLQYTFSAKFGHLKMELWQFMVIVSTATNVASKKILLDTALKKAISTNRKLLVLLNTKNANQIVIKLFELYILLIAGKS